MQDRVQGPGTETLGLTEMTEMMERCDFDGNGAADSFTATTSTLNTSQALLPTFNLNFAGNYFKFIFNFSVRFLHKNCKKFKVHAERIVLMQFYHILTFANYHFPVQALYSVSSGRNVASFSQSGSSSCPTANRSGRLLKACEHKSCK